MTGNFRHPLRQSLEDALSAAEDAHGVFAWSNAGLVPNAGEHLFALAYTPNDARNYDYSGVTLECAMTVELKDVSELTADAIPAQTYTVSALTPEVVLRDGDVVLTEGTDYTATYVNNVNAGTATIPITGQGNYTGTLSETFTIRAAEEGEDERDDTPLPAAQMAQMRQTAKPWKGL